MDWRLPVSSNSRITLTIAGDATGVEKALLATDAAALRTGGVVAKSSHDMADSLGEVSKTAKGSREVLRGLGDTAQLMGGEMGNSALQVGIALGAVRSLTKGAKELVPEIKVMIGEMSTLKFTAGLLAGTLGGVVLAWQLGTAAGNKLNDMLGRSPTLFEQYRDQVLSNTRALEGYAQALGLATDSAINLAKAQTTLDFHAESSPGAGDFMQGPVPLDATGHLLNSTNGGDTYAAAAKAAAAKIDSGSRAVARSLSSGGSSVASALDAAAQKAKDKLARWQGIADQFSNVAKGIQDSLGPKLVAGIASPLMLAKGTSVLDNLKQQLKDTLHLQKDLAQLSKMGLGNTLLESLSAGGLDSLPAADELLASGQGGVNSARKTAGKITAAGGSIAGADAARQFADSLKKPIKVELHVGKGGDDVLDKWLMKALATKGAKHYGLKAA